MEPADLRRVFANNVRRIADARGLSLNMVADIAGIARSPFFRALRGDSSVTLDRLQKIANAMDCDAVELLDVELGAEPSD